MLHHKIGDYIQSNWHIIAIYLHYNHKFYPYDVALSLLHKDYERLLKKRRRKLKRRRTVIIINNYYNGYKR